MHLAIFPLTCLKCCACREKVMPAPVMQNHLPKTEDLMLQNATPLRNSAPRPPNISDEHVSCTAPATENASLQILFKCPTPANPVETASKPARFVYFWQVHNLNVQKWSRHGVICAFRKCASRQHGVHFFDMSTSKSAPKMVSLVHILTWKCASCHNSLHFFDSKVLRAWGVCAFWLEKCSEHEVCCTFWVGNMLRGTTACKFPSLIWPAGSTPAALASLLFDPPEPQIIGKT